MWITVILIIILVCFLYFGKEPVYEHYYNMIPYKFIYNIYKCLNTDCVLREGRKCYDFCDGFPEPAARHTCRQRCFDHADILMSDSLKFNWRNFNYQMPRFKAWALFNKKDPDVFLL